MAWLPTRDRPSSGTGCSRRGRPVGRSPHRCPGRAGPRRRDLAKPQAGSPSTCRRGPCRS